MQHIDLLLICLRSVIGRKDLTRSVIGRKDLTNIHKLKYQSSATRAW